MKVPIEGGVKVVVMVQVAPALSEVPQLLLLMAKLALAVMLVIDTFFFPILVKVKLCPALVVFSCVEGKVIDCVESRTEVLGTTRPTVTV